MTKTNEVAVLRAELVAAQDTNARLRAELEMERAEKARVVEPLETLETENLMLRALAAGLESEVRGGR